MQNILVSVVLPVYNGEKYIKEAIKSVLAQTYTDYELIIVNDGSTDGSLEIIKTFTDSRIVIIDQENKGLPASLNMAIQRAKGDLIARMDADDVCMENRFKEQVDFMKSHPDCVVVGSNAIETDEAGNEIYVSDLPREAEDIREILQHRLNIGKPFMPFYHSSTMFRKKDFHAVGGYPLLRGEDVIFFNRLINKGTFYNLNTPLIKYRIVPLAFSLRHMPELNTYRSILVKAIKNETIEENDKKFLMELGTIKVSIRKRKFNYYTYLGKKYLLAGNNKKQSLKNAFHAIKICPFSFRPWFLILLNMVPFNYLQLKKTWHRIQFR
ncbi:MAG: glycosyltransferase [Bacteroidales bacterium]|nr:glycosyltransferase [Bacteroidales bacterium]